MTDAAAVLLAALGPDLVRTGDAIPERNHNDKTGLPALAPRALVLPRTTADVSRALKICHDFGQPVVTQGGMTGLAGGAIPGLGEIAVSLERMSGIEEIDTSAATLTALAGTPLQTVQAAAADAGFFCGIDLGARGSCTIGGNIATNAGGNQVLRYGMARRNVLGLEAVLADGTVLTSLNKMLKNNTGYDWPQLIAGSEGTLGIITRAVIMLHPKPEGVQCALLAVDTFDDALKTLRALERGLPGGLITFEGMWSEFYKTAIGPGGVPAPFPPDHDLMLLIEAAMGGGEGGAERFETLLAGLYEQRLVKNAVVAKSQGERAKLWALRESPYDYTKFMPQPVSFDISIPLSRMSEAVALLRQRFAARWPDVFQAYFGHIADSNLHVVAHVPGQGFDAKKEIEKILYGTVKELGGSISAEHGIGRAKRDFLSYSRSPAELAVMSSIKKALDPKGILNPGRVL